MSQHDLILDNGSGAAFRADANNALAALGSSMKGPSAPPSPLAGMVWVDDDTPSATIWTIKRYDGAEWIEEGRLDVTNNIFIPSEGVIAWADVASAATTDIGAAASRSLRITGTTTITSLGTAANGIRRKLRFAGALTLTHNAGSLILPGGTNIITAAGDIATAISLGSGNWIVVDFMPASGWRGSSVVLATSTASASATLDISGVFDDALYARYELELIDLVPATNDVQALLRVGTGAGPTWQAGSGAYNSALLAWATASQGYPTAISNAIALSQQPGGGQGVHSNGFYGLVRFWTPQSARIPTFNIDTVQVSTAPVSTSVRGSAIYGIATAITGLRFLFSSGNIASGSIRLLGYRK
jgi:hypothetical protein